jgi:small subunit ribosomal protein S4
MKMGSYHGPKVRLTRRAGAAIAETPKHLKEKKLTRPGMHGLHRPRQSLYGQQLAEKQKLSSFYNIPDAQMRKYVRSSGSSGALTKTLESRLDNIIRRAKWARSIWQARQMVSHGHFLVNECKVDLPSFEVKAGDKITVKPSDMEFVKNCAAEAEEIGAPAVPAWLNMNNEEFAVIVAHLPGIDDVKYPFEIDYGKIIEYYTR